MSAARSVFQLPCEKHQFTPSSTERNSCGFPRRGVGSSCTRHSGARGIGERFQRPRLLRREAMTNAINPAQVRTMDMKLEVVVIPVSDVDRAKEFYGGLGWRLDADFAADDDWRVVQFTPPGSGVLGHLRQECHRGCARLRSGTIPRRFRHRGCSPGAAPSRREDQRDVPRRRRRVPGTDEPYLFGSIRVQRSGYRASQLPLARLVQRSGRQWLAAPGNHRGDCRAAWRQTDLRFGR